MNWLTFERPRTRARGQGSAIRVPRPFLVHRRRHDPRRGDTYRASPSWVGRVPHQDAGVGRRAMAGLCRAHGTRRSVGGDSVRQAC